MNLPNLFTLLRVLLTPWVAWAIFAHRPVLALSLFAIAAFTDYLDGATARRLHLITASGAVFDPLADKCLLSGIFLALAAAHILPWWLVGLVFGRDVYILAGIGLILMPLLAMRWRLSRPRGVLLIAAYGCYLAFLLWRQGLPLPLGF